MKPLRQNPIAAISVAVALLAVVIGLAIALTRDRGSLSDTITRVAPELGSEHAHLLLPNLVDAQVVVIDRPHDPREARQEGGLQGVTRLRRFSVSTNALGLRGPPLREPPPPDRVLCLGDSVTFGWGVEVEQSYPALLAQGLGAEVVNAGVPAMKPQTIAAWAQQNAARYSASLVIFARRPDWSSPDGWRGYIQSIRQVQRAVAPARLAVVLPPVSSFDVRGSQQYQSEAEGARRELPQVPLLDLTDTFRAAQAGLPGVMLRQSGGRQQMVEQPSGRVVVDAAAPPEGGLAPEMIAAFEAEHDLVEPLFFDGGHPDAAGFELYAEAVAKWLKGAGLR